MKIVSLGVANIKRVVAVEITPDGNLVQITGKNGNGKSSILDAIWWGLAGKKPIQSKPIRNGANHAVITLVLGDPASDDPKKRRELTITRTFSREDDGGYTTSIKVKNADGWTPQGGGQSLLDELIGSLSFDPLAFARMDAAKQFEALKQFVPDFDFEANAGQRYVAYDRRTTVNGLAKQSNAAAGLIVIPANTPDEPVDDSALVDELQHANDHNAQLERRKTNRENHLLRVDSTRREASLLREQALESRRQADELDNRAAGKEEQAAELQQQYDTAEPLPTPIDVSEIRTRIAGAKEINAAVQKSVEKAKHRVIAQKYERESEELTARIADLDNARQSAIARAHMPVDGLGFGEGTVLLNGLPFDQASDAERLRASIAIAARSNPTLRVIRVRDGSLLDPDGMKLLGEIADGNDMQVWVERVDASGEVGFVIEDGRLKGQTLPEATSASVQGVEPAQEVKDAPGDAAPELTLTAPEPAKKKQPRRWQGPGAPTGDTSP